MLVKHCIIIAGIVIIGTFLIAGCLDNPSDSDAGKPHIVSQTQNSVIDYGDSTVFTVAASGDEPMTYQWYRSSIMITGATNSVLVLRNVELSDTGNYYVVVKNAWGEATSEIAKLTIRGGEPIIESQSKSNTVSIGDTVSLFVQAEGNRPFTYKWFKDSLLISGANDSALILQTISTSDTGVYFVILSNTIGADTSDIIHLSINGGGEPIIGSQSKSHTVSIGDTVSLFVQAAGNGPFIYKWFKDSSLISGANDSVLILQTISISDTGIYVVIVSNSIGADTSDIMRLSANADKLFITESDFQSGLLEWASIQNNTIASAGLSIFNDAGLKSFGGYLYILERFGADNIMKYDPSKNGYSAVLYQTHLGDNWNPQDIEFVSETKAYISNMGEPKITIFNPLTGTVTSHIDISVYTFQPDSNSSPYANDLQLVGNDLYVMLQRRNSFNPGAPTLILKINTSTNTIVDTIALQYKNGYTLVYTDGALYVSNPGSPFATGDGAIEKVDLSTKAVSTVIDEATLGGSPNYIVHKSGSLFYVTVYVGWENVKVVELDVASGTIVSTLPGVKDAFGGIYYDDVDAKLYVGERDPVEMGIRVFRDNVQTGPTIKSSNSLPPTGMVIVR